MISLILTFLSHDFPTEARCCFCLFIFGEAWAKADPLLDASSPIVQAIFGFFFVEKKWQIIVHIIYWSQMMGDSMDEPRANWCILWWETWWFNGPEKKIDLEDHRRSGAIDCGKGMAWRPGVPTVIIKSWECHLPVPNREMIPHGTCQWLLIPLYKTAASVLWKHWKWAENRCSFHSIPIHVVFS